MYGWLTAWPTVRLTHWLTGQLDSTTVRQRGGAHSLANTHTFMHLAAACRILERMRHCDKMFLLLFFCLFVYTATAAATSGMRHAACMAHVPHTHIHKPRVGEAERRITLRNWEHKFDELSPRVLLYLMCHEIFQKRLYEMELPELPP